MGIIFDIKRFAIHDGTGIRTTVFLKGCPLNCWWCHNPESQSFGINNSELREGIGPKISVKELVEEIEKDTIFFDESNGGVTFSGGEPLSQAIFLKNVLLECKKRDIHTTLDTSGYADTETFEDIAKYVDLFLFDLKLIDDKKHQKYTGVSNEQILINLRRLSDLGSNIIIRIPVIPGINDTDEDILQFIHVLKDLRIKGIDLLPYHKIAAHKYQKMELVYKMDNISEPSEDSLSRLRDTLKSVRYSNQIIDIRIGG